MSDRILAASQSPTTVVDATGLLAEFNDAGVLHPLDVLSATTVARLHDETDERVVLAAALTVRGTRYGHVCIRLGTIREAVTVDGQDATVVDSLAWPDPVAWEQVVRASPLTGEGGPLVWSDGRLYLARYFDYEQRVASLIRARLDRRPGELDPAVREILEQGLARSGEESTQLQAAIAAMDGGVTVIAGGPGTGKTYTIGTLLAALASTGSTDVARVALCAPTGKAAARLGEAVRERAYQVGGTALAEQVEAITPSTIHRLLGWSWGRARFARNETNRLPHDLVVVDEMSMVSLPLAAKLLVALKDEARLVLVGDPFQLESIEAGTVLADIVGAAGRGTKTAERIVVLDRVYRFEEDGSISDFADAVRAGDGDRAVGLLEEGGPRLRWIPDRQASGFEGLWQEITEQRIRQVRLADSGDIHGALAALTSVAVLCAHRRGPRGVSRWGQDIETALDERFPGLRWNGEWYPGRPVMITRNDYNLDLYNGDIGVAVKTDHGLRAVFERGDLRTFPLANLTEHTTVHAMTIHKSQGSQFEQVVVVLPDDESRLLTRELLYTAVTRAREQVWIVGEEAVVRQAIGRSVERASGLSELL